MFKCVRSLFGVEPTAKRIPFSHLKANNIPELSFSAKLTMWFVYGFTLWCNFIHYFLRIRGWFWLDSTLTAVQMFVIVASIAFTRLSCRSCYRGSSKFSEGEWTGLLIPLKWQHRNSSVKMSICRHLFETNNHSNVG